MLPDKVIVHCSERNTNMLTLDGVDVMGERLAEEVIEVVNKRPDLRKISFIAHSVGGLVSRYAIGRLYRPPRRKSLEDSQSDASEDDRGTTDGLEAINFITVATPHLGSRGNKQVPFPFGLPAMEKVASCVIHWIFRRTGKHLFLTDDNEGKPPLLQRKWEDSLSERYPHIVYEEHSAGCRNDKCADDLLMSGDCDLLEGKEENKALVGVPAAK